MHADINTDYPFLIFYKIEDKPLLNLFANDKGDHIL